MISFWLEIILKADWQSWQKHVRKANSLEIPFDCFQSVQQIEIVIIFEAPANNLFNNKRDSIFKKKEKEYCTGAEIDHFTIPFRLSISADVNNFHRFFWKILGEWWKPVTYRKWSFFYINSVHMIWIDATNAEILDNSMWKWISKSKTFAQTLAS